MRGGGVQTSRPHHVGINRGEQSQETGRFGRLAKSSKFTAAGLWCHRLRCVTCGSSPLDRGEWEGCETDRVKELINFCIDYMLKCYPIHWIK